MIGQSKFIRPEVRPRLCRIYVRGDSVRHLVSDSSLAAEKWADTRLTVQEGLELWLDAAQAAGEGAVADNAELKEWLDASGKGRHLKQADKKARPKLMKVGGIGIVRFDGIDDHFRAVKQATTLDSFTIVIVAVAAAEHRRFSRVPGTQCGERARLHERTEHRPRAVAHGAVFGTQRGRPRVRRRPKPAHARIDVRPTAHARRFRRTPQTKRFA